jgi:aryl-alcohol dehydrogenase-like predicted oxidoreductase
LQTPGEQSFRHIKETGLLEVPDLRLSSIVPVEDRSDVEITGWYYQYESRFRDIWTAKLFSLGCNNTQSHVSQAFEHLHRLLGVSSVENFILSASKDNILPAWRTLEQLHCKGAIGRLGVTDFTESDLQAFAGKVQVQPAVNQIDLAQCCQLPRELIKYAKSNDIELLAHSDCSGKSVLVGVENFKQELRNWSRYFFQPTRYLADWHPQ